MHDLLVGRGGGGGGGGGLPLKMTWFRCSHTDHKVAKICRQSTSRRKTPPLMDRQNSSSKEVSRWPTPAARHAACASGHWKKMWLQSSSASLHNGHTARATGSKRRLRVRIMMRRLSNSHPNRRIFSGSRCFHTNRLENYNCTFVERF